MPRKSSIWFRLLLLSVVLAVVATGCPWAPGKRPAPGRPLRRPSAVREQGERTLSLFVDETGERKTIKLEEYLAGVVAAEMEPNWPKAALGAQAIVARTFTLERLKSTGGVKKLHGTDVCTNPEHFQAYDPRRINDNVREAVRSTRGMVITWRGDLVKAYFHSNSGGKTATLREGLNLSMGATPYLRVVDDSNLQDNVPARDRTWTASFSMDEIRRAANKGGGGTPAGGTLRIARKGPSGRVVTFTIDGSSVPAPDLRLALGSEKMRSTLIDKMTTSNGRVTFTGRGFGHGVGMSQWGANALARQGKSAEDIVKFYYKGVQIQKLYD